MNSIIDIRSDFAEYKKFFLEENSKHNLISRNDEKFLYEKHIYDSLSIKLFFDKYGNNFKTLLDIGCGGGFPCIPIAIEYPGINITGLDSINKKIASVEHIKQELNLNNLNLVCDRAENLHDIKFDIVVSRAVADLAKISAYAAPFLDKKSVFIAYKSVKANEEISNALPTLNKLGLEIFDTIKYTLPTEEMHARNLICIKRR